MQPWIVISLNAHQSKLDLNVSAHIQYRHTKSLLTLLQARKCFAFDGPSMLFVKIVWISSEL